MTNQDAGMPLHRAGSHVAIASAVSRATGLVRSLVVAAVIGVAAVADAYNGANSFPNMVYELLLGGILSSILVPWLIRARLRGSRYSVEFTQRLLVACSVVMLLITIAAVAAAPVLAHLLVADHTDRKLTTMLAYLLLPQIFFYGLTSVMTAVLNARERFVAGAWAPVVNNVVLILTAGMFALAPGPVTLTPSSMTAFQIVILGSGTTLGVVLQAVWVVLALRRTGFRWSWRVRPIPYTWRPIRTGIPLVGWIFAYAALSQIGVAVTLKVAFDHSGVSIYTYADLIFLVPFGILSVSLMTIFMPRIALAVAASDTSALLTDVGRAARYTITALVPVIFAMSILAPSLAKVIFVGRVDVASAELIGITVAASAFGLIPLSLVMLQMRVFYANNDARTPVLINLAMVVTKVVTIAVSAMILPSEAVVVMLGVGSSLSYAIGASTGHMLLRRRYGLLGFRHVAATLARVSGASAVGGCFCLVALLAVTSVVPEPRLAAGVALISGTLLGGTAFLLAAQRIGVPELQIVGTRLTQAFRR